MSELLIGAHTSAAGGVFNALKQGQEIGATTIQFFTSNQKQWAGRPVSDEVLALWNKEVEATGISKVMSHDSYLINLGAPDSEILAKSRKAFGEEIERCLKLNVSFLNFHPGAAIKECRQKCLDVIVESLLEKQSLVENSNLRLLLEATAGQGSCVGCKFEELAYIIKKVEGKLPIGVCIDTCHIFTAGYDVRTPEAWERTLQEFDQVVGLQHLYAFHLNDSVKGLGSRVDRHASLGKGQIGLECFRFLVTDPRTRHLPMYLETPEGPSVWKEEIALLKSWSKHEN